MHLRARDPGYQRQPTLIHKQMTFAAELATIGRKSGPYASHLQGTAQWQRQRKLDPT